MHPSKHGHLVHMNFSFFMFLHGSTFVSLRHTWSNYYLIKPSLACLNLAHVVLILLDVSNPNPLLCYKVAPKMYMLFTDDVMLFYFLHKGLKLMYSRTLCTYLTSQASARDYLTLAGLRLNMWSANLMDCRMEKLR